MSTIAPFEIFLATAPGLESALLSEAHALGFQDAKAVPGGVTFVGGWRDVWSANLRVRGANRVLARIASFRVLHLAQLDKRARRVDWRRVLRADIPVRVEATCKKSRIYHSGAAAERIERALSEEAGCRIAADAQLAIRARIEADVCELSVDTSGDLLHKRGFKEEVNRAPLRETIASLLLRQCGYQGTEPVVDPMCGSGTFVIEAAEICAGLMPGRSRHFSFESLATFDEVAWRKMREEKCERPVKHKFYGSDRDAGAVTMSRANAVRAGVSDFVDFQRYAVSDLIAPQDGPGLVIVNPPYGNRIGERATLFGLYQSLGRTLLSRFKGWRVGVITSDTSLAQATRLPFLPTPIAFAHGGLRVALFQTPALT